VFDKSTQYNPPLVECTRYKDIIFFLQELSPQYGMGKINERDLKLKAIKYFILD